MKDKSERTAHEKFIARHASHIENVLLDEDRRTEFDPALGKVYSCQELRCGNAPPHAHCRRPYLVWNKE